KTFKTLPFIMWNYHYKGVHGQKNVPLPKDLYNEKLIRIQFWLFLLAIFTLAAGILLNNISITKTAMVVWMLVALLYLINVKIGRPSRRCLLSCGTTIIREYTARRMYPYPKIYITRNLFGFSSGSFF